MMRTKNTFKSAQICFAFFSLISILTIPSTSFALKNSGALNKGKSTGLPVPRFASLKADEVNVRIGPDGKKYKIKWVYKKAGLPVEIIAEFSNWRHVRDSEGVDGWVFHALLSGRRTALVTPWAKKGANGKAETVPLYKSQRAGKNNVALLVESGVLAHVIRCTGEWCRLSIADHQGWIQQKKLWGVYQDENIR